MTSKKKDPADSDLIWAEISKLPMAMWSLPNQSIKDHVKRLAGFPSAVLLTLNSPAALPALEASLDTQQVIREETKNTPHGDKIRVSYPKFELEQAEGYVIVKRSVPAPEKDELKLRPEYFISGEDK